MKPLDLVVGVTVCVFSAGVTSFAIKAMMPKQRTVVDKLAPAPAPKAEPRIATPPEPNIKTVPAPEPPEPPAPPAPKALVSNGYVPPSLPRRYIPPPSPPQQWSTPTPSGVDEFYQPL